jgi:hypothetical protein
MCPRSNASRSANVILCAVLLSLSLGTGRALAQGVTVAVTPGSQTVALGAEFDLVLQVTQAGSNFNGFDAQVSYDPAALTLIPKAPTSLQIGALMANACGTNFHRFLPGASVDTITEVVLCNGISVTGPGAIYKLHFKASSTAQVTNVRIVPGSLKFYNAGLFVLPVQSADAAIGIGTPVTAVEGDQAHGPLHLSAFPNPGHGSIIFSSNHTGAGPESLTVRDVQGRTIRTLAMPGRQASWDGRRETGETVADGIYFATLHAAGRATTIRVSWIH